MCGIAGVFSFNSSLRAEHRSVVARLNAWQAHRGPDGEGLWASSDHTVIFGHRRLAIIDTGASGSQPMHDATGRWTITFNGEIYNYRALRAELERSGTEFLTNSDTEVLINVVAQWGAEGLCRLRGMYAFALWDDLEKELWLVRDPYGIKPLYYGEGNGALWIASQARALTACAPVDRHRDAAALTAFYLWGFVPEPFTWWTGVKTLPPGHVLRIRWGRPLLQPQPFSSIPESFVAQPAKVITQEDLHQLMLDSVRHHLVADTPVGIFLSAGIDSNTIAALASVVGANLRTVTLAFEEYRGTPDDEAPLAEATAKLLGADHTTVYIGRDEFETVVGAFFEHMDQPSADGLNTYLVSRAAASLGLKVVLSGLGGDELFGGYPSFQQIPKLMRLGRFMPRGRVTGKWTERFVRALPSRWIQPKLSGVIRYSHGLESIYFLRRALHLEADLEDLLDPSWYGPGLEMLRSDAGVERLLSPVSNSSLHAQISVLESCWYMRNQLLRDADWASMAHSLEVRVPFVDSHLLAELAPAIASNRPPTKRDLCACSGKLSSFISERAKTGFTTPVRRWIATEEDEQVYGLRGWASQVHRRFRDSDEHESVPERAIA